MDTNLMEQLKILDFEMKFSDPQVVHNHSDYGDNFAAVTLVRDYDSVEEAVTAENHIDSYLDAAQKGAGEFKTTEALEYGYRRARAMMPNLSIDRSHKRIAFTIPFRYEMGDEPRTQRMLEITQVLLNDPLFTSNAKMYAEAKHDALRALEDTRTSDHKAMCAHIFDHTFFKEDEPFPFTHYEDITRDASAEHLREVFDAFRNDARAMILYSGNESVEAVAERFHSFVHAIGTPQYHELPEAGVFQISARTDGPYHVRSNSDRMQYVQFFPFKGQPDLREQEALGMFNESFGGAWRSRLKQIVREKHNLVYRIKSVVSVAENGVIVSTSFDQDRYNKVRSAIDEITQGLMEGDITREEFAEKKHNYLMSSFITPDGEADSFIPQSRLGGAYGRFVVRNNPLTSFEETKLARDITYDEMMTTMQKFFDPTDSQIMTYSQEVPQ